MIRREAEIPSTRRVLIRRETRDTQLTLGDTGHVADRVAAGAPQTRHYHTRRAPRKGPTGRRPAGRDVAGAVTADSERGRDSEGATRRRAAQSGDSHGSESYGGDSERLGATRTGATRHLLRCSGPQADLGAGVRVTMKRYGTMKRHEAREGGPQADLGAGVRAGASRSRVRNPPLLAPAARERARQGLLLLVKG